MNIFTKKTVKSITGNALLLSMILHVILLIALFYFTVRNENPYAVQDKLDATITTIPKEIKTKLPIKTPLRQLYKTTSHETATVKEIKVKSITPEVTFQPQLSPTEPTMAEQPRLKSTEITPDVNVDVSTALRELPEVEEGLSKTEATGPTLGGAFGTKKSGTPGIQRKNIPSTLDIPTNIDGDDIDSPTKIGDLGGDTPKLPYIPFENVMKSLAEEIVDTSEGGPIDVVFLVDASGSMGDNIKGVADHLVDMIDVYESSEIDYELGLTEFATRQRKNVIKVHQLTDKLKDYKQNLLSIVPRGDERALDAIAQTVQELKFRATSKKHFIIVTDEPLESLKNRKIEDAIALCREFGIYVNVLGIPNKGHQLIAQETDGKWHAIPQNPKQQKLSSRQQRTLTAMQAARLLRNAKWQDAHQIGRQLLKYTQNAPVDVLLFIDGSKSMEEKVPDILDQLDIWMRDWDNALIDYQIGVVRFRKSVNLNRVNVFNPPQTLQQIRKIVELPCQEDESLLFAISDGLRRIKLRLNAQLHVILITDEPISEKASAGTIQLLREKHAVVSVLGTIDDFQQKVTIETGGLWIPIPKGHTKNNTYW
ncbi:VWA domain-containing protein [Candidatus Poribacteria bacterium]|nr:VWA domain-containing protein [Candidatus Poribacteria bacterium]